MIDPNCLMERISNSREVLNLRQSLEQTPQVPINKSGAFLDLLFDLSGASGEDITGTVPSLINQAGYGMFLIRSASAAGAVLDIDCGGIAGSVVPGQGFYGYFDSFKLRRSSSSVTSGWAVLRILLTPNVRWEDTTVAGAGGNAVAVLAQSQTYNSAAGNEPSLATDGLSLAGARGVRFSVDAGAGNTVAGGTVKLWYYSADLGVWCVGQEFTLTTGHRGACIPDQVVAVPYGRIAAELESATNSAGSGNFATRLEVF